jgi:hypothetical protein
MSVLWLGLKATGRTNKEMASRQGAKTQRNYSDRIYRINMIDIYHRGHRGHGGK